MKAALFACSLLAAPCSLLHAGTVELFTGEKHTGTVALDAGLTLTPTGGTPLKFDFGVVLRATLRDGAADQEMVMPGVVLRSGVRAAGPFGTISDPVVPVGRRELKVPGPEIAWVVYDPFPASDASKLPPGKVGALLPGGDFFEGKLRGIEGATVKLLSPIFGPRNFAPVRHDLLALVLHDVRVAPAQFEVRLTDGSLLHADALAVDKGALLLRGGLLDGQKIDAPDVAEIRAGAARFQPLATLWPARVTPPPGVAADAALGVDAMIGGGTFTLPDRTLAHYLDAVIGGTPVWEVPAGMTVVTGQFVVPPKVAPNYRLVFAVYADGRSVFRSSPMSISDPPQSFRVTLGAARAVALRVEPHFPSSATGSGIWIEPTLLRR